MIYAKDAFDSMRERQFVQYLAIDVEEIQCPDSQNKQKLVPDLLQIFFLNEIR